jgi:pimeloyl-ACP methyl ester carboxylesterase
MTLHLPAHRGAVTRRAALSLAAAPLAARPANAQPIALPPDFVTRQVEANGVRLHLRSGGTGPAVVLLHGYTQTGDMWAPLAADLARDHTVLVPDLRGLGLSGRPEGGYDKWTQAADIAAVLDAAAIGRAAIIGHDIGTMVGFAFAARFPDRTARFAAMEAPIPGIGPWDEITRARELWHFSFGGPDAERLVAGRERIYLDRFWNAFASDAARIDEATRDHYARLYAQPGAMRAGFAQFAALARDVEDNRAAVARGRLAMPVLAVGGALSFGATMAAVMRAAADDVREHVIAGAGHWLMEEAPEQTGAAVRGFLADAA